MALAVRLVVLWNVALGERLVVLWNVALGERLVVLGAGCEAGGSVERGPG